MTAIWVDLRYVRSKDAVDFLARRLLVAFQRKTTFRQKRLVEELSRIPSVRTPVLPLYARLVAIINKVHPSVGAAVTEHLTAEFKRLRSNPKLTARLDLKIQNARFIAELVKFRVVPSVSVFRVWRDLLDNLNVHNAYALVTLLEHCGLWLYCDSKAHARTTGYLSVTRTLIHSSAISPSVLQALETVVAACKPSASLNERQDTKSSLIEEYVRDLLYVRLDANNVDFVVDQLCKLDWSCLPALRVAVSSAQSPSSSSSSSSSNQQQQQDNMSDRNRNAQGPEYSAAAPVAGTRPNVPSSSLACPPPPSSLLLAAGSPAAAAAGPSSSSSSFSSSSLSATTAAGTGAGDAGNGASASRFMPPPPPSLLQTLRVPSVLQSYPEYPPAPPSWMIVLRSFLQVNRFKMHTLPHAASVLLRLFRRVPLLPIFIDYLLEDVRATIDANEPGMRQTRVVQLIFLSELANLNAISSNVVFDILYLLISLGHSVGPDHSIISSSDPPYDHFRARLVYTLLKHCRALTSIDFAPRTRTFLLFFQRYMFLKQVLPLDLEFDIQQLFAGFPELMRGRLDSYEACESAITKLLIEKEAMWRDRGARNRILAGTYADGAYRDLPIPQQDAVDVTTATAGAAGAGAPAAAGVHPNALHIRTSVAASLSPLMPPAYKEHVARCLARVGGDDDDEDEDDGGDEGDYDEDEDDYIDDEEEEDGRADVTGAGMLSSSSGFGLGTGSLLSNHGGGLLHGLNHSALTNPEHSITASTTSGSGSMGGNGMMMGAGVGLGVGGVVRTRGPSKSERMRMLESSVLEKENRAREKALEAGRRAQEFVDEEDLKRSAPSTSTFAAPTATSAAVGASTSAAVGVASSASSSSSSSGSVGTGSGSASDIPNNGSANDQTKGINANIHRITSSSSSTSSSSMSSSSSNASGHSEGGVSIGWERRRRQLTEEEANFEREFQQIMSESLAPNNETRRAEGFGPATMYLRNQREEAEAIAAAARSQGSEAKVTYKFLSRPSRGSSSSAQSRVKELEFNATVPFVASFLEEEEARRAEEAHIKRITLEQMARQSEAEPLESIRNSNYRTFLRSGQSNVSGGGDLSRNAKKLQDEYLSSPENLQGRGGVEKREGMDDDISMFTRWQFSSVNVKRTR